MHDEGSLPLAQMFPLNDKMEKFTAFAVPKVDKKFSAGQIRDRNNFLIESKREYSAKKADYLLKDKEADIVPLPDLVQLNDIRVILNHEEGRLDSIQEALVSDEVATYQHFEDVDFVNEGCVVLHLLLLDCLDGKLLPTFPVLCKVDDSKATVSELLLEGIDLLDVPLCGVDEVLRLVG